MKRNWILIALAFACIAALIAMPAQAQDIPAPVKTRIAEVVQSGQVQETVEEVKAFRKRLATKQTRPKRCRVTRQGITCTLSWGGR